MDASNPEFDPLGVHFFIQHLLLALFLVTVVGKADAKPRHPFSESVKV
jgi:hypothetical protein